MLYNQIPKQVLFNTADQGTTVKFSRAIAVILITTACSMNSWEFFNNVKTFKDEDELANYVAIQISLVPSNVTEKSINNAIEELNNHSATSNLDRSEVIKFLRHKIAAKILYYQQIQQEGASYSKGITALGYAAILAALSGIFFYFDFTHDQRKKEIEDELHKLGADCIISGSGFASAYAPISANQREIKYHLRRLAGMADGAIFGAIFTGIGYLRW